MHDAVQDLTRFALSAVLFDLNLHNDITDASTSTTIRACTPSDKINYNAQSARGLATAAPTSGGCGNFTAASNASIEVIWSGKTEVALSQDRLDSLLGLVKKQLGDISAACKSNVLFSKLGNGAILGFYAGENVDSLRSFDGLAQQLSSRALSKGSQAEVIVAQHCGKSINGASTIGLVLSTKGDLGLAQKSLLRLSNATCVDGLENSSKSTSAAIFIKPKTGSASSLASVKNRRVRNHESRASVCSTVQVVSGDSCASLATECGISGDQFSQFNPNICSALTIGQFVCCSAGSLPDFSPQPGPGGTCATYTVQANDFCDSIAKAHFITSQKIESFNANTWGWQGCSNVQLGQVICLSTGSPPFPAAVSNAICGPQVPGTKPPADFSTLAGLNPCPLNSCCNIYGQCGITPDFCTISKSATGAPGTSAPGTAGCISNCGTTIVNNNTPPKSFLKVGYWEAFSVGRSCLAMSASQIPTGFTHIHYAFASITPDFQVDISANSQQFQEFTKTSGFKKIISFGGWSFSTDSDSFPIFRTGVTAANRMTFAQSIVNMVNQYALDGVDFDWEYPGAPDIPGIPPGSPTDGPNYLAFLQTLRSIMPAGKTISMAAPASYWYLRGFPIKDMAPVLDYIVFMTYDLHGQWDYGSAFSNPGCPTGNCLRSHINSTETAFALSMITKAGVPTNKIIVGVSSYGRAFGVSTPGCIGPECLFTGPASGALVGPCTQTAGYLADAEIQSLVSQGGVQLRDDSSDSDIVTYANTWVAFMSPSTKTSRIAKYKSQNFAGTVDWALDLETGTLGSLVPNGTDDNPSPTKASLSSSLTCTTLAPGATFTLTAACAQQIQNLGPLTDGNKPPGPANCIEDCDLLRDITGTCCGTGGTLGFPVSIIPNVALPLGLALPPDFQPSAPLVIPGYSLQPGQKSKAPIPLPKGFQPPVPITIPGGVFPPGQAINISVILPPGFNPLFPISVGGTVYPPGEPLPTAVPLPPDFIPPKDPDDDPLVVPPFTINPGDPPALIQSLSRQ
ncbi:hypothetical protein NQ176_g5954 [Zarea fungicola]|uniref:Uncharacterized protein n=1 Tax=Zarea fungicola TaxID=93591 RepID=A0ACC1N854_9HYPO|nr:hypothetical protein NQ176_g5954 [Lecanicillium fungicola]